MWFFRRLSRLLRRYCALGRRERRALREASLALAGAALTVQLVPFRRIDLVLAGWSGRSDRTAEAGAADRVCWAVAATSRYVPWRTVCFQQGLAAHWMLRRRGIPSCLHYGAAARADAGQIAAHVWVSLEGTVLVGGDVKPFRLLKTYPHAAQPGSFGSGAPA